MAEDVPLQKSSLSLKTLFRKAKNSESRLAVQNRIHQARATLSMLPTSPEVSL